MTFQYLKPPFSLNHPEIAQYPSEVTGNYLLRNLSERLGWNSLAGKRLLDFGCGVRFAQTIANLYLDIGYYAGIDVNVEAIAWLQDHLPANRFGFAAFDMHNALYRPDGKSLDETPPLPFSGQHFDAACLYSVITHTDPDDTVRILDLLRHSVDLAQLYFTAFISDAIEDHLDVLPDRPLAISMYNQEYLRSLVTRSGWRIEAVYEPSALQQTGFVCAPA